MDNENSKLRRYEDKLIYCTLSLVLITGILSLYENVKAGKLEEKVQDKTFISGLNK